MSTISRDRDQSAESETALSAKRSAAKRRIQLYHQQLLKGCGNDVCTNEFCASSSKFCYKDLDSNSAATTAVELMKRRAPLCNDPLSKKTVTSLDSKYLPAPSPKETSQKAVAEIPSKSLASNKLPALTSSQASVVSPKSETVGAKRETASAGADKSDSPVCLTEKRLLEVIDFCRQTGSWTDLNRYLGIFFRPEVLMSSFPVETPAIDMPATTSSKELMRSIEFDRDKDLDELESVRLLPDNDDSSEKPSISALTGASHLANSSQTTMDIESMRRSFTELYSIPDVPFQSLLVNAIVFLARTLETDLRSSNLLSRRDEYVNLFLIVMEIPALGSPEFLEAALPQFCKTVGLLSDQIKARLARIWSTYDAQHLTTMVGSIQQLITVKVVSDYHSTETPKSVHDDDALTGAVKLLKILYYASVLGGRWDSTSGGSHAEADDDAAHNRMFDIDGDEELEGQSLLARLMEGSSRRVNWVDPLPRILGINLVDSRQPLIPFDDFVNEPLSEIVEMDKDFINYRAVLDGELAFSFMLHPFVLTPTVKHVAMYFDNRIRMMNERRAEILNRLMGEPVGTPHLKLSVRRDHLIDDALVNLEMLATDNPQALKKQLFVEFDGEQGIDEGGPSKEFFQLIIEELFNPDIGMFTYDEETRHFWFNSVSFETEAQYKLIGILLGLAIYNNVILDVHFPMVVYRKLMGRPGTFEDLKISHPTLARSLQQMLEYEGDVAADFMQPFCIGASDVFGHSHIHLLKENGDQIIVTNETTKEFVELYAEHLLNKSVDKQFSAFRHGFKMVTDESPLQLLFRPDEVELLICGSKNYDFVDLERSTQYDGGFTADSQTIKYFWETVHELSEEQKRQLLQFTTGSDRVPIGGLSQLKLVIARNGSDSDRLPTAHTCFNVLLLPEYESKAKLRDRLLKAITFFKGFGML